MLSNYIQWLSDTIDNVKALPSLVLVGFVLQGRELQIPPAANFHLSTWVTTVAFVESILGDCSSSNETAQSASRLRSKTRTQIVPKYFGENLQRELVFLRNVLLCCFNRESYLPSQTRLAAYICPWPATYDIDVVLPLVVRKTWLHLHRRAFHRISSG